MPYERLDRIESKLDGIVDKIGSIDVTLAAQKVILEEHQRRSLANEKIAEALAAKVEPIAQHVAVVEFIGKVAGIVLGSEIAYLLAKKVFKF